MIGEFRMLSHYQVEMIFLAQYSGEVRGVINHNYVILVI